VFPPLFNPNQIIAAIKTHATTMMPMTSQLMLERSAASSDSDSMNQASNKC